MTATSNAPCQPNARNCFTSAATGPFFFCGFLGRGCGRCICRVQGCCRQIDVLLNIAGVVHWLGGLPFMRNLRPRRFRSRMSIHVLSSDPRRAPYLISHPSADRAILAVFLALFVWFQTPIRYHSTRCDCTFQRSRTAQKWHRIEYHAANQSYRQAADIRCPRLLF